MTRQRAARVEPELVPTVRGESVIPPEPAEVAHCALLDVTIERERLHCALKDERPEIVLTAAMGAMSAWLRAVAALGRVRAREAAACQRARQVEHAVGRSRLELVAQLERVLARDMPSDVRDQLRQLRCGLALAWSAP